MDADALPDLAHLLTAAVPRQTRAATCAAIAGCTSGPDAAALRKLIGSSDVGRTIIRRLLAGCGDAVCGQLALYALINLSEEGEACDCIVAVGGVDVCVEGLGKGVGGGSGDEDGDGDGNGDGFVFAKSFSGLLSNLTRREAGLRALLGMQGLATGEDDGDSASSCAASAKAEYNLLRMLRNVNEIPNLLWLSNLCTMAEGRQLLLLQPSKTASVNNNPFSRVVRVASDNDMGRRLAIVTMVRNCAMDTECHVALLQKTCALGVLLARLVAGGSQIVLEHVKDAPEEVRSAVVERRGVAKGGEEEVGKIRVIIAEVLLLLCGSEVGLRELRERDAFLVLFEWCKVEAEEEVKGILSNVMERISKSAGGGGEEGSVSVVG